MAQNICSHIIKGLLHWYRWILSLVGISVDAHKLTSFNISAITLYYYSWNTFFSYFPLTICRQIEHFMVLPIAIFDMKLIFFFFAGKKKSPCLKPQSLYQKFQLSLFESKKIRHVCYRHMSSCLCCCVLAQFCCYYFQHYLKKQTVLHSPCLQPPCRYL